LDDTSDLYKDSTKFFEKMGETFLRIVSEMIAKWIAFKLVTAILGGPASMFFQTGGKVPGIPGTPVPIVAHAGETVVPAGGTTPMSGGEREGTKITLNNYFEGDIKETIDVDEIAERLAEQIRERVKR